MKNPVKLFTLLLALGTLYLSLPIQHLITAAEINVLQYAPEHTLVRATIVAEGSSFAWIVTSVKNGQSIEVQSYDEGQSIVFTGPPGVYSVIGVTITDGKVDIGQAAVTIGEVKPTPKPDDPDVPTPPTPDIIPDDQFNNVGKLAFQCASKLPAAAKAQASATANLYKEAVAKMKTGELVNGTAAQNYVKIEREKIWGGNSTDWMREMAPVVDVWNKQLLTKGNVMAFYEALAAGLSAVK